MRKILYVEDDTLIARLYSQKLVEAGFEVAVVEDGLAAMKRLPEFMPDLVVLDLLMPKMTGADVLKFIRERPELGSIRIVVFSNSFLSHLTEEVAAAKVERALVKSGVTPAKLIRVVREVLDAPSVISRDSTSPASASPADGGSRPRLDDARPTAPTTGSGSPVSAKEGETEFRARVRGEFFDRIPVIVRSVRRICRDFIEAEDVSTQLRRLEDLLREIGFLAHMTGMAGCQRLAHLSSALEALLFELQQHPELITDSSRHTVTATVAFLADRLDSTSQPEERLLIPPAALVVDDDAVSNHAIMLALGRANMRGCSATDAFDGLKKLEQASYDLVLLDVNMPGMDGIQLCEEMRGLPNYKRTPVIFVTGQDDFKTRARSVLSGGDDLIAKPVVPLELVVKAITLLLKKSCPAPAAAPPSANGAETIDGRGLKPTAPEPSSRTNAPEAFPAALPQNQA